MPPPKPELARGTKLCAMTDSPELARLVAKELARHLTDVVICPGSRNSPLSLALLARDDIRVHTRIDERSASFLALGMARFSKRHVGVVTTSGTAVANCVPAMVEASHAHVPFVMISADRPEHLIGTGANQTINQQGIFGTAVATTQISAQTPNAESIIAEAFTKQQVHLNVALDVPLVEETLMTIADTDAVEKQAPFGLANPVLVNHGEVELDLTRRTLVIAGDEAWEVPGLEDVPAIAEPTAPAPFHPVHPLAASVFARQQVSAEGYVVNTKPEQIVVVGHPTLHRGVSALMEDEEIELYILSRTETVTNPARREAVVGTTVKVSGKPTKEWLKICDAASDLSAESVRDVLSQEEFGFTGLHAAAAVGDTVATNDCVFIGSSNPVRDLSFVGMPFDGVDTFAARGAAGIDGSISQAIGMAIANQSEHADELRPPRCLALLGDVTFLHDVGGLLIGPDSVRPENLTIVVANDDGGGIFETLEVGAEEYKPSFERAFGTPHEVEISDLCGAYGIDYVEATDVKSLIEALQDAQDAGGFTVIEAHTTRETRRAMHQALSKKVTV